MRKGWRVFPNILQTWSAFPARAGERCFAWAVSWSPRPHKDGWNSRGKRVQDFHWLSMCLRGLWISKLRMYVHFSNLFIHRSFFVAYISAQPFFLWPHQLNHELIRHKYSFKMAPLILQDPSLNTLSLALPFLPLFHLPPLPTPGSFQLVILALPFGFHSGMLSSRSVPWLLPASTLY